MFKPHILTSSLSQLLQIFLVSGFGNCILVLIVVQAKHRGVLLGSCFSHIKSSLNVFVSWKRDFKPNDV